jgi:acyl-CoA thioesterase
MAEPRSAQQTAEQVRDGMLANDRATKMLGMTIVEIAPGRATLTMPVRDDMLNGHDICHGGLIATLADSAFAFACNSYDELTVASGFAVDFVDRHAEPLGGTVVGEHAVAHVLGQLLRGAFGHASP